MNSSKPFTIDPAYLLHNSLTKEDLSEVSDSDSKGARNPQPRSPSIGILCALGIVQLHVVNLRIVPPSCHIVDIEMSLNLPIDIDHRTIWAMVRDQNLNLRRPILLFRPARNAAPEIVSTAHRNGVVGGCSHAQVGPFGSQYGVPEEMIL